MFFKPNISFNLSDEKGINEQAKKQSELITLLSSILEDPAKNNSAYITNELRRLGRPVYNKGGYVSQMDELGLASEGTLVPRASTEVPVTTKDSKRVSQEEVLANLKTLSETMRFKIVCRFHVVISP